MKKHLSFLKVTVSKASINLQHNLLLDYKNFKEQSDGRDFTSQQLMNVPT